MSGLGEKTLQRTAKAYCAILKCTSDFCLINLRRHAGLDSFGSTAAIIIFKTDLHNSSENPG